MFYKIRLKLSFICCLSTTLIVLVIILCCLKVSEKNMYGQEKALFFLRANNISTELYTSKNISIHWYMNTCNLTKDILYIEVNGSPSTLSTLTLSDLEHAFIYDIRKFLKTRENIIPCETVACPSGDTLEGILSEIPQQDSAIVFQNISSEASQYNSVTFSQDITTKTNLSHLEQQYFKYKKADNRFLIMNTKIYDKEKKHEINAIYLYNLKDFYQNVKIQRIWFFAIWFISILVLSIFSYIFTSHTLKPIIENDEKQKHFIAFASHELRSPLAVFKTGLSILKNKPDTEKSERIYLLIDNEMSRMERLIQDLLCLVKIEQSTLSFEFELVNLTDLVASIYEKYFDIAKRKNISLSLLKDELCNCICFCDVQRIEQAIIILLDNALSYTPSGQSVSLHIYQLRMKCYIQVIDTGIGITNADKEKIFDKFYQVDSSHNKKEHFGLGLSIAKEICYAHGGKISVSDTKGGGSTFTIRLPSANAGTLENLK